MAALDIASTLPAHISFEEMTRDEIAHYRHLTYTASMRRKFIRDIEAAKIA